MPLYRQSIDHVLQRVRDPQGTTHSRAFTLTVANHAARVVNAALAMTVETVTLATNPFRIFYSVAQDLPRSMKIVGVKEAGRSLDLVPWTDYYFTHSTWQREQSGRFRTYSLVGRDVLVIWPSKDRASSVEVTYSLMLPTPVDEDEDMLIPDHAATAIEDLAELILSVRGRSYPAVDPAMKAFTNRVKALDE